MLGPALPPLKPWETAVLGSPVLLPCLAASRPPVSPLTRGHRDAKGFSLPGNPKSRHGYFVEVPSRRKWSPLGHLDQKCLTPNVLPLAPLPQARIATSAFSSPRHAT